MSKAHAARTLMGPLISMRCDMTIPSKPGVHRWRAWWSAFLSLYLEGRVTHNQAVKKNSWLFLVFLLSFLGEVRWRKWCACVHSCVCACVRACVRACVCACVCYKELKSTTKLTVILAPLIKGIESSKYLLPLSSLLHLVILHFVLSWIWKFLIMLWHCALLASCIFFKLPVGENDQLVLFIRTCCTRSDTNH